MRKASVFVILLSVVLTVVLSGSSLALVMLNTHPELELAQPVIGPQTRLPQISSGIPYSEPAESKGNPLGSTYLAGTTWYDYQHNG
ncbi:hypothetical protein KAU04_06260, partial [bacterium]|nr:hypothetical protein [bacterium]